MALSHCLFLSNFALASPLSAAANTAVSKKVEVGVPKTHEPGRPLVLRGRARAVLFETHEMDLLVPGNCVARDQSARIATGACCADRAATAKGCVGEEGVTRRSFAKTVIQSRVIRSRI